MEPFAPKDGESHDIINENVEALKSIFPEAFTEDGIDFDALRQLLGDDVADGEEKYGLNWFGKKKARQIALTPSLGTLRPCKDESVDWDNTKNLFIEGDNLEVLKLLQKSYANKIKMIYIDPPYNTGKDFVYPDNFRDNIKNYLDITGQTNLEGKKKTSNSETSGRYHTDWLNMLYPRLKLARNLLKDNGSIFISIDDVELPNIRKVCDEVFGEENFIAHIIWKKRSTPPNDKIIGTQHDYIIIYCKNHSSLELNLRERSQKQIERYKNPDNHPKGPWASSDLTANVKGGRYVESLYYGIVNPNTGEEHFPSNHGNWRFNKDKVDKLLTNNEIYFGADGKGKPMLKRFLCDIKAGITWTTLWDFVPFNTVGSNEMREFFGSATIFENPKPSGLIESLMKLGMNQDDIILDFFAGSASTAHATLSLNEVDGGNRKFILVQLPEVCNMDTDAFKAGYKTISEISKQRIRRVIDKIKNNDTLFDKNLGFKAFKLDQSNLQVWNPDRSDLDQTLIDHMEHILDGRTEEDVLYELLLKRGVDLSTPIEEKQICEKTVYSIGYGVLFACLDHSITREQVEDLADGILSWYEELKPKSDTHAVFRDAAFADDITKTNLTEILKQRGITHVRSL